MSVTRRSFRRALGYMLTEALVASGLLGVALTSTYHQLGYVDRSVSTNIRRLQAATLLEQSINSYRSRNFADIPAAAATSETDFQADWVPPNSVSRHITISTMNAPDCAGCKRVTVLVKFTINGRKNALTGQVIIPPPL